MWSISTGSYAASSLRAGGIRFAVGSLGYLLRNRFYIGEVVYRGEVHRGEHEPILERDLFEAVQAKLAANAGPPQGLSRHSGRPHLRRSRQPHESDAPEQRRRVHSSSYIAPLVAPRNGASCLRRRSPGS